MLQTPKSTTVRRLSNRNPQMRPYRKLFAAILDGQGRQALGSASLFLRLVQSPYFEDGLVRQVFRYGDEKCSSIHLFDVGNRAHIVRPETPDDLKGRGKDPNVAIVAPYEEVVRARADGAELIALTESA